MTTKRSSPSELLIGAHTSAAGGAYHALLQGQEIGASTIQFFTSNQKRWEGKDISEDEVFLWGKAKNETDINITMSHDSYLINLGSPDPLILSKSEKAFKEELKRCHLLDVTYLNFHPGAHTTGERDVCLDTIIKSLKNISQLASLGKTRLLFETTAGQGSCVGCTFEEIGYLIQHTHPHLPVGVCIDTCHIFAAGYDIRTKKGVEDTIEEFDQKIGLQHLYAFHLNDSKNPLGSRKDRHEQLGDGEIGIECFQAIMSHPKLRSLPKYLETPDPARWPEEIKLLKKFAE
jgi:deoxyribonuclease-4